jgi:hypothetical protein
MTSRYVKGPTSYEAPRANPKLLEQKRKGEHVWVCVAAWVMPGEQLLASQKGELAAGEEVHLMWDAENLADFSMGCFVCEQPFSEELYHRKCTGDPGRV